MSVFSKSAPVPSQAACVAAALSTIAQVMNQMALQNYLPPVAVDFLGPIIFTSSKRAVDNVEESGILNQTLKVQSLECKGIASSIVGWDDAPPSYKVAISEARTPANKLIFEDLSQILESQSFKMLQQGKSVDEIMDKSYSSAFEIFSEFFTIVGDDNSGFHEIHSQITNLLSSSFVLFVSDILKNPKDCDITSPRVNAMVKVLASTSALFATVWDAL